MGNGELPSSAREPENAFAKNGRFESVSWFPPGNGPPNRFVFRLENDLVPTDDLERFRARVDALPTEAEREAVRKARICQESKAINASRYQMVR